MEFIHFIEFLLLFGITILLALPLGSYMAAVFTDKKTIFHPILSWLERLCYRITGIDPTKEMSWWDYTKALFYLNLFGFIALIILQRIQGILPLNPQSLPAVPWTLAFNIAASFTTNTDWQPYAGETTLSYFTQMVALTSQNFLSAATGMATLLALIRGLTGKMITTLGNFWVDLVRSIVYLLIPLSILLALILVSQGVIQTFSPNIQITTLEESLQTIPLGPVASQVAIKQLGSNGGGFFNANSAHPFENPTALTNLLEMVAIILIPTATVYMYGLLINSKKHAVVLLSVVMFLLIVGITISIHSENLHNPAINAYPLYEGIETRFGITNSLLWTVLTTAISNGSVNSSLTSLPPLAGAVAFFNIGIGEVFFGGVGVGLCSMLMFTMLAVFLSGLMVGRTPEKLGKKIEKYEIQWIALSVLLPTALTLTGAGIAYVVPEGIANLKNYGPHELTEILYACVSCGGNNGSMLKGLEANTPFYNLALGCSMLIGRTSFILPSLAIAGSLGKKNIIPPSSETLSTNSMLFVIIMISIILMIGALSYFPALVLGPIIEHLLMLKGMVF